MKNLFEAVELNNLRVKNRLIRSATWEGIADFDGSIGENTYKIYRELAKGGIGAIITGFTSVSSDDFYFGGMMRLSDNNLIPQYKKLVEIIHSEDCAAISQLALGAFYDKNGVEVGENDLSTENVREIIKMFVDAAIRAEICGFDGVQIHAAHFFFLSRFISPRVNGRTDEFGGSTEARAKIGTYDNFTEGDPSKFLRDINNHMPTAAQNKLIFIERTGHTYQQKHQEIADIVLNLAVDWTA